MKRAGIYAKRLARVFAAAWEGYLSAFPSRPL